MAKILVPTKSATSFFLKLQGETLFELIDTPGFQRPYQVYNWLKKHEQGAASHPQIIQDFLSLDGIQKNFPDEYEILSPIVNGAGILYVVDGSIPYGLEYEAELEILRWTGSPRMALINPISSTLYLKEWETALSQFFNVVRVFNAEKAEFDKQLELLDTFGQLKESWKSPLKKAVSALSRDRHSKCQESALIISNMLIDMLNFQLESKINENDDQKTLESKLQENLKAQLIEIENTARSSIERIFRYENMNKEDDTLFKLAQTDLFSSESWRLFGLDKKDFYTFSALSGAAIGGSLDLASGGSSLLMGSFFGGLIGATTAFFAADKLVDVRIVFLALGQRVLVVGPVKNLSFPHLVFKRARFHFQLLLERTHANRSALNFDIEKSQIISSLKESDKLKLEKCFRGIRNQSITKENNEQLRDLILKIINKTSN